MKKSLICLIVAIVAVVSLICLPLLTVEAKMLTKTLSESANFIDVIKGDVGIEFCVLMWFVALIAGACAILGAIKNNKKITFVSSVFAACTMVFSFITILKPQESMGVEFVYSAGIGMWITIALFAANAVLVKVFEKEWEE